MRQRVLALCAATLCALVPALPQTTLAEPAILPDGRSILSPPPAPGSHAQEADMQAFANTRALRGSKRWQLAHSDADLHPQRVIGDFSCAAGFTLNADKLPALLSLLNTLAEPLEQRVMEEKNFWHRPRPFVGTNQDICTPDARAKLTDSFAYPSGHTTWGWLTASILASALPERATEIMQRGRIFGESRIVCGVHWKSDVQAGYMNGSAMFAALQAQPWFVKKMAAVRSELETLQSHPIPPDATTCAVEHEAAADTF
ncbi:phosphatase PAP2 family protein [Acetobacter lambici]|uniref:Acid phosphatase n=1 Tax=Acetobacter lambici TaxID=1332824 RepID=A0ABT1F6Q3_9PROT|nr:phosphatase PAP2 family protein [Acetobacter lambici]MCP1243425.1 phosphatase PAP2 family protein [Acetobacter lambici]MCP1259424.1 phosphatase PAP2 family protein [Acetobacter lambici]NHO57679.1 phosphatase PAP2 family protein [Acetobacter lambici]